jgi:acylphosphatase
MTTLKIQITGKVYHTGYRYFIKQLASLYEITGDVNYCPDRSVEILATGEEKNLDKFLKRCRIWNNNSGVEQIKLSQIPPVQFDSFEVVDEETSINTIVNEVQNSETDLL